MTTDSIASYDFSEDAMGLGDFITQTMASLPEEELIVYVRDQDGNEARAAVFERETLTDGSAVVNLRIDFDDPRSAIRDLKLSAAVEDVDPAQTMRVRQIETPFKPRTEDRLADILRRAVEAHGPFGDDSRPEWWHDACAALAALHIVHRGSEPVGVASAEDRP